MFESFGIEAYKQKQSVLEVDSPSFQPVQNDSLFQEGEEEEQALNTQFSFAEQAP